MPFDFCCFFSRLLQIVPRENSSNLLSAHYLLDSHPHINTLHEVILGEKFLYLIFPPSHGDLHSYVRQRKRLKEAEAKILFRQIVETVQACHEQGIVLRDLKLRKFVFADPQRYVSSTMWINNYWKQLLKGGYNDNTRLYLVR